MRLDKFLAEASVATRTLMRTYIKAGYVTVNGEVVLIPEFEIDEYNDIIKYQDLQITHTVKQYYMFHKPGGCITARQDANCKTVLDYFDTVNTNALFPVGRLDKDTEGLLFLTNDGTFGHHLTQPGKNVMKKYYFWALGSLNEDAEKRLKEGFRIEKEGSITRPATINVISVGRYQEFKNEIEEVVSINQKRLGQQPVISGYLTISEGHKHQVKRMLRAVGCGVIYLKRISIGEIALDLSLEKGQFRTLTELEVCTLMGRVPIANTENDKN
jgi:16S rRNA pseudouridine516 synthase